MRIGQWVFTGLGTSAADVPSAPWCGMHAQAKAFEDKARAAGHDVETFPHPWNGGGSPDALARLVFEQMIGGDHDRSVVRAHSFGFAFLEFYCRWLDRWHPGKASFDVVAGFDGAPNPVEFGEEQMINKQSAYADSNRRWGLSPTSCREAVVFFQRGGRTWGVQGVPLAERPGILNFDLTDRRRVVVSGGAGFRGVEDWGEGEPFDHLNIIPDSRVSAIALAHLSKVFVSSSATAGDDTHVAGGSGDKGC